MEESESMTLDGCIMTKVPLKHIRFLGLEALKQRIIGAESERFSRYQELIRNGHYANGLSIVYRTPKGNLFASDLRHSDLVLYAEQHTKRHASVPFNEVHPVVTVKVIEVASPDDIPVQRAAYLERNRQLTSGGRVMTL